jgi:hypothetical protein
MASCKWCYPGSPCALHRPRDLKPRTFSKPAPEPIENVRPEEPVTPKVTPKRGGKRQGSGRKKRYDTEAARKDAWRERQR